MPHSAAVNFLLWLQHEYRLTQEDVVLQKTPCSFDVSVGEFFWPLTAGARLVMAPPKWIAIRRNCCASFVRIASRP